jgi:hypothetical protein
MSAQVRIRFTSSLVEGESFCSAFQHGGAVEEGCRVTPFSPVVEGPISRRLRVAAKVCEHDETADNGGQGCGKSLYVALPVISAEEKIVIELRRRVIVRGALAKTAGRGALHRFAARQQRAWTDRCQPRSRDRRGWVANNGRHPVECNSLRGDREAGPRYMQ